ncbi:MAG: hypothetical protein AAF810_18135 [Cyanobacteria bacterium P01_D01_bin.36]
MTLDSDVSLLMGFTCGYVALSETFTMFGLAKRSPGNAAVMRDRQIEDDRMRDVELLLESLFLREEVTLRLVVDCLYDVGSMNLVNQKVRSRPLNRLMKAIARLSKPAFRPFMMRWSRKNCPHLIAEFLHSQVRFRPQDVVLPEVVDPTTTPSVRP